MIHPQPIGPWGPGEWGFFLLANVIIVYFCAPKVFQEFGGWLRKRS